MTYLARRRRAQGLGDDSLFDTVLGVLTLGASTRQKNREKPYQAIADYFAGYRGRAPYVVALVTIDGELVTREVGDEATARGMLAGFRPQMLYGVIWDAAHGAYLMDESPGGAPAGTAAQETIEIRESTPSRWWVLALVAGGVYYYSKRKR